MTGERELDVVAAARRDDATCAVSVDSRYESTGWSNARRWPPVT